MAIFGLLYSKLYSVSPKDSLGQSAAGAVNPVREGSTMAGIFRRNGIWYATYYLGSAEQRKSLRTRSRQVALERMRQIESDLARGTDPFPTETPIPKVLQAFVNHLRTCGSPKAVQSDIYRLRTAFGLVCDALKNTSRHGNGKASTERGKKSRDTPQQPGAIRARCFEAITTHQIACFISERVEAKRLSPKTANGYREILHRLFNWAMSEGGIRMPQDRNPVSAVRRRKERASDIRFLALDQIREQLMALAGHSQLQTMVAVYIYAGLRREEALLLRVEDMDFRTGKHGMIRVRAKRIDGEFHQPKTGRNRAVPINSLLRAYLNRYAPPTSAGNWYFPSPEKCRWDPDNFSRYLRIIQRKVGFPWTCLDFRHTFGSQLAMKGVSLYKISKFMGNSPEICRRHYAALIPEDLADDVEFRKEEGRSLRIA